MLCNLKFDDFIFQNVRCYTVNFELICLTFNLEFNLILLVKECYKFKFILSVLGSAFKGER